MKVQLLTFILVSFLISTQGYLIQPNIKKLSLIKLKSIQNNDLNIAESSKLKNIIEVDNNTAFITMLGIPLATNLLIPYLLTEVTNFDKSPQDRQWFILALLISKRVAIYSFAGSCLDYCAKRSINVKSGLGERLLDINNEIFDIFGETYTQQITTDLKESYEALDELDGTTQAISLPLLLGGFLIASFLPIALSSQLSNNMNDVNNNMNNIDFTWLKEILLNIQPALGYFSAFTGAIVCILFARIELKNFFTTAPLQLQNIINNNSNDNDIEIDDNNSVIDTLAIITSIALVGACELSPNGGWAWPLQNYSNAFVAVTVARVASLPRLSWIILALVGLAVYDVTAVNTQVLTDGGASIMEAVARAKAGIDGASTTIAPSVDAIKTAATTTANTITNTVTTTTTWRPWIPGLFDISVGGKPSDLLGVGDVVFPAILAGWSRRFDANYAETISNNDDNDNDGTDNDSKSTGLYTASVIGFAIGCLACELFQTGSGQPALIFLVPSMLTTVGIQGARQGILHEMWNYGNGNEEN